MGRGEGDTSTLIRDEEAPSIGESTAVDHDEGDALSDTGGASSSVVLGNDDTPAANAVANDSRYPLSVPYCSVCGLPAEVHEYHSRSQFEKCRKWMAVNCPELFPEVFPEEAQAKLEALKLSEEVSGDKTPSGAGPVVVDGNDDGVKVAVPIEQKGTVGKKKKLPAEIVIMLAQRKGKKQVTLVYGLDLFGIKLADAAKAAKKKFATGASVARSADNRDVIEIQGTRQEDFAELVHKVFGVPKVSIFVVDPKSKKKRSPFDNA
jgi:density-regulated protein DRP1